MERGHGGETDDEYCPHGARLIEEGHDLPIWTAAYSPPGAPRGPWLVTAGMDGQTVLWNMATGTQFARIMNTGLPAVVAVSRDGQWIATSYTEPRGLNPINAQREKRKVRFWNVKDLTNSGSSPAAAV